MGRTIRSSIVTRQLGRRFFDSDKEVERQIGETIRTFFEREGESAFREIEEAVLSGLVRGGAAVIATGGGAILREATRRSLHTNSTVVYLRTRPEELFRRLRHDTRRPLLQVDDPLARLQELFAFRDPLYVETAHFVIETRRPSVAGLVNTVMMQLEAVGIVDHMRSFSTLEGS